MRSSSLIRPQKYPYSGQVFVSHQTSPSYSGKWGLVGVVWWHHFHLKVNVHFPHRLFLLICQNVPCRTRWECCLTWLRISASPRADSLMIVFDQSVMCCMSNPAHISLFGSHGGCLLHCPTLKSPSPSPRTAPSPNIYCIPSLLRLFFGSDEEIFWKWPLYDNYTVITTLHD